MSVRASGTGDEPRFVRDWAGGLTWIAHPAEAMQRASHALLADGDVWLVDPVDAEGVDDAVADLGEVAGVLVLLDRHRRDAAAFAERHGVAVHVPETLGDAADGLGVPVERFAGELADTGYRARPVVRNRFWREAALVRRGGGEDGEGGGRGAGGVAVVPEALGTTSYFTAPGERVGVNPMLRLLPPRAALGDLHPERLLVGHGLPVHADAGPAIRDALAGARRRAPRLYLDTFASWIRG